MINSPVKVWRKQKEVTIWLGKRGKVISYSMIRVPPLGFLNQAPYLVAVIEFKDGTKRMGQLVEVNENQIKSGLIVQGVLRRIREVDNEGVIPYGVKWKPLM